MDERLIVGRGPDADVIVHDDPYISPRHCVVERLVSGDVYVTDLGSTNGTWIIRNGVKHQVRIATRITPGCTLVIGRTHIPWHADS